LAGLYDSHGEFINSGLAQDLAEALLKRDASTRRRRLGRTWVLNVCPQLYQSVVEEWIEEEPRITVLIRTEVTDATVEEGRIVALTACPHRTGVSPVPTGETAVASQQIRLRPKAVVDASGVGAVVRAVNPDLMQQSTKRAAGGLIFSMCGVEPKALEFPRGLAILRALREAAECGSLPASCGKTWLDSGVQDTEAYVKLFVPLPENWSDRESRGEITRLARETQTAVVEFLKQRPEFARARVCRAGELGVRDGGRVHGEYCLTVDDVRAGRKFEDAACRAYWPIEYWDPDNGVSLEYLPGGSWYDIPMRALKVKGMHNLWVAGKCLSADPLAQASARVVGTCWAMGEAAGKAAAGLPSRDR
jgi:hypothetical protein